MSIDACFGNEHSNNTILDTANTSAAKKLDGEMFSGCTMIDYCLMYN